MSGIVVRDEVRQLTGKVEELGMQTVRVLKAAVMCILTAVGPPLKDFKQRNDVILFIS